LSLFNFPDLRLTVKLPLLIVATAISVAIAAGVTASWTAYHLSERMIESHLTVIATAKRDELAALVRAVRSDLQSIAGNPAVQRSLDGFAIGFKLLDAEKRSNLRIKYAVDVPPSTNAVKGLSDFYGAAYQDMHPWFKTFAREHGYEDVVFIDRDGNIAYTLAKRPDYTQSAVTGPLAASVLGRAVGMARRQIASGTVVTDFALYEPAGFPVASSTTTRGSARAARR
jgi:methyl-accepting chemotaxis protein